MLNKVSLICPEFDLDDAEFSYIEEAEFSYVKVDLDEAEFSYVKVDLDQTELSGGFLGLFVGKCCIDLYFLVAFPVQRCNCCNKQ